MNMTDSTNTPPRRFSAGLKGLALTAALAGSFIAGGVLMSGAPAAAFEMAMGEAGMGEMGPMGMHGMHGHGHAMMQAHLEKMLTALDATPEQKEKIKTILHHGFEQIGPVHQKMAAGHKQLHDLLTAPTIDRGALEQLRASEMADFDQASKGLVQTLADAAEVLTPAQRAKLATMMAEHHHHAS
jgi:Spy/CpxP family protein refolding chaperone